MALGIVLHAALPYFPNDIWPSDNFHSEPIRILFEFIHVWRMPVFFILAGFFARLVIGRHSGRYWSIQRLRRIGLPLLVFWPVMAVMVPQVFGFGFTGSFPGLGGLKGELFWEIHHLWFLVHLLIFVLFFWFSRLIQRFLRLVFSSEIVNRVCGLFLSTIYFPVPAGLIFILFVVLIGSGGEVIFNPFGGALYFFFGYGLFSRKRLFDVMKSRWPVYLSAGLVVFVFYLLVQNQLPGKYDADDGLDGLWSLLTLLKLVCAVLFSFGFIGLAERRFGSESKRLRWLSDSSYWIYLIHLPIVTMITFMMFGVSIPVEIKFLLAIVLTSLIGILTYKYLVRRTLVGVLLNGKR